MDFASIWYAIIDFYYQYDYAFKVVGILVLAGIFHFILHLIHRWLHAKLKRTQRIWDDALTQAFYKPLKLAIWVLSIYFCIQIFHLRYQIIFFNIVQMVFKLLILGVVFLFLVLFARSIVEKSKRSEKHRVDYMTVNAISKLYYIIISAIMGLAALEIIGIPLSAVIAFGGVGGLAVGFAAKDFLANLFGGLMIFVGRPFVIGDVIRSPDREIMGTVEEMGWRQVKLRTFDRRPLYVPNSLFSTIIIENVARMHTWRILFDIGIRYQDISKAPKICSQIEKAIHGRKDIDMSMTNYAKMIGFDTSSVNLRVCCYPKTKVYIDYLSIQQEIFLKTYEIISENRAEIAFPTRMVIESTRQESEESTEK